MKLISQIANGRIVYNSQLSSKIHRLEPAVNRNLLRYFSIFLIKRVPLKNEAPKLEPFSTTAESIASFSGYFYPQVVK